MFVFLSVEVDINPDVAIFILLLLIDGDPLTSKYCRLAPFMVDPLIENPLLAESRRVLFDSVAMNFPADDSKALKVGSPPSSWEGDQNVPF